MNKTETQMRRGKNVNKLIFSFLVILSFNCFSQNKLSGVYSYNYLIDDFYSYFEFKEDGTFTHQSGSHLGDLEYGKGHYYIRNDSLSLNYNLTELRVNSFHKARFYKNSKNSIKVKLNIYDINNRPLPDVSIIGDLKKNYGKISNQKGKAVLEFNKEKRNSEIKISDLCCGQYTIQIDNELNYEIDVFLKNRFNNPIAIKDEVLKYKILSLSDKNIKLKTKNGVMFFLKKK